MQLFRRFRERREKRRKEREEGVKRVFNAISRGNQNRGSNIFRSERVDIDQTSSQYMHTMDPTDDEDDATMTSSIYTPPTESRATEFLFHVHHGPNAHARKVAEELHDMTEQLDELQNQLEISIAQKDDELLVCQIGFGFAKEDAEKLQADLDRAMAFIQHQDSELELIKSELTDTEHKLNETIMILDETKESLAATSALLKEAHQIIEQKDLEIFHLGKALEQGKRGAKVVLGLLTLGALWTDDHR